MAVTAEQIAELRRLANEPTDDQYTDSLLQTIIEKYPMLDELGSNPYYWVQVSGVPTKQTNINWIPTYDMNASAAQVWREKSAMVAGHFDFNADGGDYKQSQEFVHADSMARFFQSRSSIKTILQVVAVNEEKTPSWIGNLPEHDEIGS